MDNLTHILVGHFIAFTYLSAYIYENCSNPNMFGVNQNDNHAAEMKSQGLKWITADKYYDSAIFNR